MYKFIVCCPMRVGTTMVGQKWACVGGLTIAAAFLSTLVLIPVTPHALQTGLFAAKAGISVAFSAIYPWTSALFPPSL